MSEHDWAADQGDKWLAQLSGLEAMMQEIDIPLLRPLSFSKGTSGAEPLRIADIACGGGGTTFEVEKLATSNSVVHGFDISSALVSSANSRAKKQGSFAIFRTANMQLEIPPGEKYDYLVSRFGVMFFDDPSAAFSNINGWLKPGGKFTFAVWGDPKQNLWMSTLREVAGRYVELPKVERSSPGPFRYSDTNILLQELETAGFKDLEHKSWRCELPLGGGLDAVDASNFALAMFTLGEPLRKAGGSVFSDAQKALIDTLKTFEKEGKVMMSAYVHIVSGCV